MYVVLFLCEFSEDSGCLCTVDVSKYLEKGILIRREKRTHILLCEDLLQIRYQEEKIFNGKATG